MLRTSVFLVASFGLLAGCATSSANSSNSNPPDAGKVDYDVGQPSGGSGAGSAPGDSGDGDGAEPAIKGRDSTTTRGASVGPKVVKRIAASKPPKAEEPAPAKPKPGRVGRIDPNGLLGEVFAVPTTTDKLPDFSGLGDPSALFIANTVDGTATTPLAGLPQSVAAPVAIRFTGSLNVLAAGEYKLCTAGVDGSQLYIEETLIVDNDGVKQEPSEMCELVSLDAGEYMLELRTFHVTGPILARLSWAEGKEGAPVTIPSRSLYKPEGADARVKAGK